MADNPLNSNFGDGDTVEAAHAKQIIQALDGALAPRRGGVVTAGQDIGNPAAPFGTAYIQSLVAGGQLIDFSTQSVPSSRLTGGRQSALSSTPLFIDLTFQENQCVLAAATVPLTGVARRILFRADTDIVLQMPSGATALTSNNTATINNIITGDFYANTRLGEIDYVRGGFNIGSPGREITSRVGRWAAFKTNTRTPEYFYGYIQDNSFIRAQRGFFFTERSGSTIGSRAQNLAANQSIQLLQTAWLFVGADTAGGFQHEITNLSPIESGTEPTGSFRQEGQYWKQPGEDIWYRFTGGNFRLVNRTLAAILAIDTVGGTSTVAAFRCIDLYKNRVNLNTLTWSYLSATKYLCLSGGLIHIDGSLITIPRNYIFDIEQHREIGNFPLVSTGLRKMFVYMNDQGRLFCSNLAPTWRADLGGRYHPYENWRCVFEVYNNEASSTSLTTDKNRFPYQRYHSFEMIPTSETAIIGSSGNLIRSGMPQFLRAGSRPSTGSYTVTFFDVAAETNLFVPIINDRSGAEFTSAGITDVTSTEVDYRVRYIRPANDVHQSDLVNFNTSASITVNASGNMLIQMELDNRYKG